MKRKIILRSLSGFPIGIVIGYLITIIISLIWANGNYSPCIPELTVIMGNEINAVLLQTFLCGLLGTGFAAASVIWDIENWGLVKQTGIYFSIVSAIMMPIAYITHWMEHSLKGFIYYCGVFALIFATVWAVQYIRVKRHIKKMNASLHRANGNKDENN